MTEKTPARLVVLASGSGSNLQAILEACQAGLLAATVGAVISDQEQAYVLQRARSQGVPAVCLPWLPYRQAGKNRQAYDADLAAQVSAFRPDLVVLAGWMRLLSMAFLGEFPGQVINLHPALPGTFPGTRAIERAFRAYQSGEIEHTGVMVHYVPDEGVDDGPLIAQETVPIHAADSLADLEARVHQVEHRLLVQAIRQILAA